MSLNIPLTLCIFR